MNHPTPAERKAFRKRLNKRIAASPALRARIDDAREARERDIENRRLDRALKPGKRGAPWMTEE